MSLVPFVETDPVLAALKPYIKGVNVYNTGTSKYPARPAGFTSVEWIGPVDPTVAGNIADGASIATDNDSWTNNT